MGFNGAYVVLIVSVLFWVVFGFWGFLPLTPGYDPSVQLDRKQGAITLSQARDGFVRQLDFAAAHVPWPWRQNEEARAALRRAAQAASLQQLSALISLDPWFQLGYYPALPLESPRQLNVFQYGQGPIGWFWLIAWVNPSTSTFVQVARQTTVSPAVDPSSPSTYNVVSYIASGGKREYAPQVWEAGVYESTKSSFQLTIGNTLKFQWLEKDTYSLHLRLGNYEIEQEFSSEQPPAFNAPGGCLFCTGGLGTPYVSYPNPKVTTKKLIGNGLSVSTSSQGHGWIDRQLSGTIPRSGFALGALEAFLPAYVGLGPYVWLVVKLRDETQRMLWNRISTPPQIGKPIRVRVNEYVKGMRLPSAADATVTPVRLNSLGFPLVYEIQLEGLGVLELATLAEDFVFVDGSGLSHWAGAASLKWKASGESAGDGFIEGSGLDTGKSTERCVEAAGISASYLHLFGEHDTARKANKIIALVLACVAALSILGSIIALVFENKTSSYGSS